MTAMTSTAAATKATAPSVRPSALPRSVTNRWSPARSPYTTPMAVTRVRMPAEAAKRVIAKPMTRPLPRPPVGVSTTARSWLMISCWASTGSASVVSRTWRSTSAGSATRP